MINHSTKIERTKVIPLRWIGNILGEYAGYHLVKCVNMDEDKEYGFSYKYHAKMYTLLNKPYELWGTYYTIDMNAWKEELDNMQIDMSGSGWDDYDENDIPYWDYLWHEDPETGDAWRLVRK